MSKLLKNTKKKIGKSPGSLVYTGEKGINGAGIHFIKYNKKEFSERRAAASEISFQEEFQGYRKNDEVLWINIDGIHDTSTVDSIGKMFGIHPLTLEDVLNTSHRPKTEDNTSYIFIVIKMLTYDAAHCQIKTEQVSFILKDNLLITFQEDALDEFEIIRENIRLDKGRVRNLKSDYLCYRLLDTIIDNYFLVLENIGEELERLEDELLGAPTKETLNKLYLQKNAMITVRRAGWPLREVIGALEKNDSPLIHSDTEPFLRDLYDHVIQIVDTTENYREMIAGMMDIYLSSVSNRLNEVMKVLTIISTIFIPLNFIAGVYGMNFNTNVSPFNMPELNWYYGYPAVLSVMVSVGLMLVLFFKRKKWF